MRLLSVVFARLALAGLAGLARLAGVFARRPSELARLRGCIAAAAAENEALVDRNEALVGRNEALVERNALLKLAVAERWYVLAQSRTRISYLEQRTCDGGDDCGNTDPDR